MTKPMMNEAMRSALQNFIAAAAQAKSARLASMQPLSGGAIQENWLIETEIVGGPYDGTLSIVLRTDAASGVAESHGRKQEFALFKAAFEAGVMVPEPLWLCLDAAVIGRHFFVMRAIKGAASGHRLVKDFGLGGDRVQLAQQLGEQLARIHSIEPQSAYLDFLTRYDEAPALYSVRRLRMYLDSQYMQHPALEWGLRWLERHAPPRGQIVLCHRDFRTGNYMVDEHGLTGILDWEFADWSDPLEDIGWFCAKCWRFGAVELEAGGIGAREDFYRGYERVTGHVIDRNRVLYWEVMAHMNWAVIALQQAERHVSGGETSLNLALTGHIVPELELEILTLTGND